MLYCDGDVEGYDRRKATPIVGDPIREAGRAKLVAQIRADHTREGLVASARSGVLASALLRPHKMLDMLVGSAPKQL